MLGWTGVSGTGTTTGVSTSTGSDILMDDVLVLLTGDVKAETVVERRRREAATFIFISKNGLNAMLLSSRKLIL